MPDMCIYFSIPPKKTKSCGSEKVSTLKKANIVSRAVNKSPLSTHKETASSPKITPNQVPTHRQETGMVSRTSSLSSLASVQTEGKKTAPRKESREIAPRKELLNKLTPQLSTAELASFAKVVSPPEKSNPQALKRPPASKKSDSPTSKKVKCHHPSPVKTDKSVKETREKRIKKKPVPFTYKSMFSLDHKAVS